MLNAEFSIARASRLPRAGARMAVARSGASHLAHSAGPRRSIAQHVDPLVEYASRSLYGTVVERAVLLSDALDAGALGAPLRHRHLHRPTESCRAVAAR